MLLKKKIKRKGGKTPAQRSCISFGQGAAQLPPPRPSSSHSPSQPSKRAPFSLPLTAGPHAFFHRQPGPTCQLSLSLSFPSFIPSGAEQDPAPTDFKIGAISLPNRLPEPLFSLGEPPETFFPIFTRSWPTPLLPDAVGSSPRSFTAAAVELLVRGCRDKTKAVRSSALR